MMLGRRGSPVRYESFRPRVSACPCDGKQRGSSEAAPFQISMLAGVVYGAFGFDSEVRC